MASAGTVTIDFAAETAKFQAELKKVNATLKSMQSDFGAVSGVISKAGTAFAGIVSVGSIAALARQAFSAADAIGDAAARAGLATSEFSRLAFAAEASDASMAALEGGVRNLRKTLAEATNGSAQAEQSFARLALKSADLVGLPLNEQLGLIADQFKRVVDPAERTRIALDLFGKSGTELIPLLQRGSAGIKELREEADRLGITMRDGAAAGVSALDDALKRLRAATFGNVGNLLGENALFFLGPDKESPISIVTFQIVALKKARDSLVSSGSSIGIFDAKGVEDYNQKIAAAEERLRQIIAIQEGAFSLRGPLSRKPLVPILDNPKDAAAEAQRRAAAEKAAEEKRQAEERFAVELDFMQRARDARRAAEQERVAERQRINNLLIEVDRESLIGRVTQENEIFQQQIQYQSDLSALLAQVRQNLGLQEIQWEQIKSQSILEIGTQLFTGMSGISKKFAKVQQGIALAQAVWYTASGVTNALRSVPFPANLVAAAKVAAFGAVQIAKIKSTSFDNPSGSIAIGSGGIGGSDALNKTDVGESVATGATAKAGTTVYISGFISRNTIDDLVDVLKDEMDRDVTIFSGNSRQAFDSMGAA